MRITAVIRFQVKFFLNLVAFPLFNMEVEDTGTYENNDMDMEDMREITEVLHNGKALRVGRHMDNHQFFFLGERTCQPAVGFVQHVFKHHD